MGVCTSTNAVRRSVPLPVATTAPLGARCHAAHATAISAIVDKPVVPLPQVCTTVRVGARRANRSSSPAFIVCCPTASHADPTAHSVRRAAHSNALWVHSTLTHGSGARVAGCCCLGTVLCPRRMGMRWPLHLPWRTRHTHPASPPWRCIHCFASGEPPTPPSDIRALSHHRPFPAPTQHLVPCPLPCHLSCHLPRARVRGLGR